MLIGRIQNLRAKESNVMVAMMPIIMAFAGLRKSIELTIG